MESDDTVILLMVGLDKSFVIASEAKQSRLGSPRTLRVLAMTIYCKNPALLQQTIDFKFGQHLVPFFLFADMIGLNSLKDLQLF